MSVGIGLGILAGSVSGQIPAELCMDVGLGLAVGGMTDRFSRKKDK